MADLVRDADVLAAAELAATRRTRRRGLLGRDGIDGVLVLVPARSVHTIGMRFAIDVAHCRARGREPLRLEVLRLATMRPNRIGGPVWRADTVVEAEAGMFARWGIRRGDLIEVRP